MFGSLFQRLRQLGSVSAIATALANQSLASPQTAHPIAKLAISSVAVTDRKNSGTPQLVLQPSSIGDTQFAAHRSHRSHSSHRSHYSSSSYSRSSSSGSTYRPHYTPPVTTAPSYIPERKTNRFRANSVPRERPASSTPAATLKPTPAPPIRSIDVSIPEQRFEVVSLRNVSGVSYAQILDHKTNVKQLVKVFDRIDVYTVAEISYGDRIVTLTSDNFQTLKLQMLKR